MYSLCAYLAGSARKAVFLRPIFSLCAPVLLAVLFSGVALAAVSAGSAAPEKITGHLPSLERKVADHVFRYPLEEGDPGARGNIHINYPAFGYKAIDEDIHAWVTDLAEAFASHFCQPEDGATEIEAVIDSVLGADTLYGLPGQPAPFELWGAYRISRPSAAAISIAFEFWNYTGSQEGNLDILTLNYSLLTGQRLQLVDIFEKPDVALELMSSWSRKILEPRLGASRRTRMLADGTAPLVENFSSFTLTPEGICINFQPWQVASRDAGIQTVLMPLKELMPSAPLLALWGKGEDFDEQTGTDEIACLPKVQGQAD